MPPKYAPLIFLLLALTPQANAFVPLSQQAFSIRSSLSAYVDTSDGSVTAPPSARVSTSYFPSTAESTEVDTVSLGTLEVPAVGLGTISWSADKGELAILFYLTD